MEAVDEQKGDQMIRQTANGTFAAAFINESNNEVVIAYEGAKLFARNR
jgi:hypothetical protein